LLPFLCSILCYPQDTHNKDLGGRVIGIKSCCVTSSDFVRLGTPEQGADTEVLNLEQITLCK